MQVYINAGESDQVGNHTGSQAIVNDGLRRFFEALKDRKITKFNIGTTNAKFYSESAPYACRHNFLNGIQKSSGLLGLGKNGSNGFIGNSLAFCACLRTAHSLTHLSISARLKAVDSELLTDGLQGSQC